MMIELGGVGRRIHGEGLLGQNDGFGFEASICEIGGLRFRLADLEFCFLDYCQV